MVFGWDSFDYVKLPLSPSMLDRTMEQTKDTVFHTLSYRDVDNLKKLQGKKKSISAFFRMEADAIEQGVQSGCSVVAEMDANILFSGEEDVMSKPDKTGRRWIDFSIATGEHKGEQPIHTQIKKDFEKMLSDLLKKEKVKHDTSTDGTMKAWSDYGNKADGKTKSRLIAGYFDGIESILKNKKYQDAISKNFYGYMKDKSGWDQTPGGSTWDEQIVNNIKINKFHFVQDALRWEIPHEPKELSGDIPFAVHTNAEQLEKYITKKAVESGNAKSDSDKAQAALDNAEPKTDSDKAQTALDKTHGGASYDDKPVSNKLDHQIQHGVYQVHQDEGKIKKFIQLSKGVIWQTISGSWGALRHNDDHGHHSHDSKKHKVHGGSYFKDKSHAVEYINGDKHKRKKLSSNPKDHGDRHISHYSGDGKETTRDDNWEQ